MPPSPVFERRSRAALHFPVNIKSVKGLAIFSVDLGVEPLGSLCWISLPSISSWLRSPSFQRVSLLSRQAACSLALEVLCGFCRSRCGRTVAALSATDSRVETEAKVRYNLDNSRTNSLPALPKGTVKQFLLQWATSE